MESHTRRPAGVRPSLVAHHAREAVDERRPALEVVPQGLGVIEAPGNLDRGSRSAHQARCSDGVLEARTRVIILGGSTALSPSSEEGSLGVGEAQPIAVPTPAERAVADLLDIQAAPAEARAVLESVPFWFHTFALNRLEGIYTPGVARDHRYRIPALPERFDG